MKLVEKSHGVLVKTCLFLAATLGFIVPLSVPAFSIDIAAGVSMDLSRIGELLGYQGIVAGIAALLLGSISDRWGRKRTLLALLCAYSLTIIGFSQAKSEGFLFLFGLLNAVSYGPLLSCALSAVGDYFAPSQRGRITGIISSASSAVIVVVLPLGFILTQGSAFGWRIGFFCIGLLSAVTAVMVLCIEAIPINQGTALLSIKKVIYDYSDFLRKKSLFVVLLQFLVMRIGVGMYLAFGVPYMLVSKSLPVEGLIAIYAIGGSVAFLTSLVAGRLTDVINRSWLITISSLAISSAIIMFAHFPTTPKTVFPIMFGICLLYMISESVRVTTLLSDAVSRVNQQSAGGFLGAVNFLMSVGYAIGAIIAAQILAYYENATSRGYAITQTISTIVAITVTLWIVVMLMAVWNGRSERLHTI